MPDGKHITRQGETWDIISLRHYGTEKRASLLLRANPAHMGVLFFGGGVTLRIPERTDREPALPAPPWKGRV